jgi:ABC-type branched-subunit amino acid transport system ATPase component
VTCIVGPNGAGKSTVLRVVTGLLRPRAGGVRFQGMPITGLSPRAILRLGVVHVPQERSLFPRMSVLENVRLGGYILGRHELVQERLRQVRAAFPIVDERAGELARNLSGGQQKLVEFARAMMLEPRLMILDEPSTGLDPKTRALVFETVSAMNRGGLTVLLVEQNARSGLRLASRGVVMESGRVRLVGTGQAVLDDPEMARLYLGAA